MWFNGWKKLVGRSGGKREKKEEESRGKGGWG